MNTTFPSFRHLKRPGHTHTHTPSREGISRSLMTAFVCVRFHITYINLIVVCKPPCLYLWSYCDACSSLSNSVSNTLNILITPAVFSLWVFQSLVWLAFLSIYYLSIMWRQKLAWHVFEWLRPYPGFAILLVLYITCEMGMISLECVYGWERTKDSIMWDSMGNHSHHAFCHMGVHA